jgi:hypothetical protein
MKYEVVISESRLYSIELSAKDEGHAAMIALKLFGPEKDKKKFTLLGEEIEIEDVQEV